MSTGTMVEERNIVVTPFAIEADHPRMSDLLIQCIPGCRLRSAMDGAKPVTNAKTGEVSVPKDQIEKLGTFPKTRGMVLHVNPEELTYEIVDPLYDDEDMCERVLKWIQSNSATRTGTKLKGAKPVEGKLDVHRMKSLCREMIWLVKAGEAKIVEGGKITMDEIVELPGNFLLNPGSRINNSQPVYEKDFDKWVDNLSRSGG